MAPSTSGRDRAANLNRTGAPVTDRRASPATRDAERPAHDQSKHLTTLGTERDSHPELMSALRDEIRHDAEQPDRRHDDHDRPEQPEQHCAHPARDEPADPTAPRRIGSEATEYPAPDA